MSVMTCGKKLPVSGSFGKQSSAAPGRVEKLKEDVNKALHAPIIF